jgi:hypothetical protein
VHPRSPRVLTVSWFYPQQSVRVLDKEREHRETLVEKKAGDMYVQVQQQTVQIEEMKSTTSQQASIIEKLTGELERERVCFSSSSSGPYNFPWLIRRCICS